MLGERVVVSFIIWRAKGGVSETQLKQGLAVILLLSEICGFPSPFVSPVMNKAIKQKNEGRKKMVRVGMTRKMMEKIVKVCYDEDNKKVEASRRRFMIMKLFCFLGVKRFSDISQVRYRDVKFRDDGRVSVWMERSKTDKKKEGAEFVLTKKKVGKISVTKLVCWYKKSLGDVSEDSFFFPVFRQGRVVEDKAVSYNSARMQLNKERVALKLGKITWHSGRIGAATEAAKNRISRNVIIKSGRGKSSAVDIYMRVKELGVTVGDSLL